MKSKASRRRIERESDAKFSICGWKGLLGVCGVLAVSRVRLRFRTGGHAGKYLEIGLYLRPNLWIVLGRNRGIRVSVVGEDVALDAGRNRLVRMFNEPVQQEGVGDIGQAIATRLDDMAGIQIAIREYVAAAELTREA